MGGRRLGHCHRNPARRPCHRPKIFCHQLPPAELVRLVQHWPVATSSAASLSRACPERSNASASHRSLVTGHPSSIIDIHRPSHHRRLTSTEDPAHWSPSPAFQCHQHGIENLNLSPQDKRSLFTRTSDVSPHYLKFCTVKSGHVGFLVASQLLTPR